VDIPILVEPLAEGRFRARAGEPFGMVVEAANRPEALKQLETQIKQRLEAGAELVSVRVRTAQPQPMPGEVFKDDPLFDEWLELIAENRRREEAENP
jgi:hypothetical protein